MICGVQLVISYYLQLKQCCVFYVTTQELLSARKRAKKDMKNAPTEFEKAVQNGRQVDFSTTCLGIADVSLTSS